ncbi:MAG: hypothetical protein OXG05_01870 [Gammaproteobacteria bacterium]|nr:hypothetical protein [Gammaproteobacteria bacterium]
MAPNSTSFLRIPTSKYSADRWQFQVTRLLERLAPATESSYCWIDDSLPIDPVDTEPVLVR